MSCDAPQLAALARARVDDLLDLLARPVGAAQAGQRRIVGPTPAVFDDLAKELLVEVGVVERVGVAVAARAGDEALGVVGERRGDLVPDVAVERALREAIGGAQGGR